MRRKLPRSTSASVFETGVTFIDQGSRFSNRRAISGDLNKWVDRDWAIQPYPAGRTCQKRNLAKSAFIRRKLADQDNPLRKAELHRFRPNCNGRPSSGPPGHLLPSGRRQWRRGSRPHRQRRGEPLSCKERGRGEVSAPGPAARQPNGGGGEVTPSAENGRHLTLPSPYRRGFPALSASCPEATRYLASRFSPSPTRAPPPPCGEGKGWGAQSRNARRCIDPQRGCHGILLNDPLTRSFAPHPCPSPPGGGVRVEDDIKVIPALPASPILPSPITQTGRPSGGVPVAG
jgi:hypothetical protein